MIDLGPHAVFIIWAYVGVVLGVAGLIIAALVGARRTEAQLKALEAQGIRRRSAGPV